MIQKENRQKVTGVLSNSYQIFFLLIYNSVCCTTCINSCANNLLSEIDSSFPRNISLPTVNTPAPSNPNNGGRCFIATAAYGSELESPVQFLRDFRDDVVLRSRFKKPLEKILDVYYSFSPPVAEHTRRHELFKYVMKYSLVWPFVAITKATALGIRLFVKCTSKN